MKKAILFFAILVGCNVFANEESSAGHGASATEGKHHQEIPFETIGWQAANLGILVFALFFFTKKSITSAFADREKNFVAQAEKTKSAVKDAETTLADAKNRLREIETGEASSLAGAQHEANRLKASMIAEAEAAAEKMKADAQNAIRFELEKAKAEINKLIIQQAVGSTTKKITDKGAQISKGAETEFLKQLSQVRS